MARSKRSARKTPAPTPPASVTDSPPPPDAAPIDPARARARRWRFAGGAVVLLALGLVAWSGAQGYAAWVFFQQPPAEALGQMNTGRLADHAARMEQLLRLDPTNGDIRLRYANALALRRDFQAALDQLRRARRTINTQDSLFLLADLHEKLNRVEEAKNLMGLLVTINPTEVKYNEAYLRLIYVRMEQLQAAREPDDSPRMTALREENARAVRNWVIRAPHDPNSHLFLGNYYVKPLYALQAYRCYLMGLSNADWLNLRPNLMIPPGNVMRTIGEIINGKYAKPYRGLP